MKRLRTAFFNSLFQHFTLIKKLKRKGPIKGCFYPCSMEWGFEPLSKRATNTGRIDVVLEISNTTYIMELKLDSSAQADLE